MYNMATRKHCRQYVLRLVGYCKDLSIAKGKCKENAILESAYKIHRLYESATANGFTSFAEA